jgi:hypothetical protein
MYTVTANDDYNIGEYETLEGARSHGREMVDNGWFLYCRIYHNGQWVEDVK